MKKIYQLQDITKYFDIPAEAVAFMQGTNAETACGRYEFGPDCYINVMETTTTNEAGKMEAHDVYVDVQFIITGEERIYYANRAGLQEAQAYDAEKDFVLYSYTDADSVDYTVGEGVILYPEDAHLPCRPVNAPMYVKKGVVKVRCK